MGGGFPMTHLGIKKIILDGPVGNYALTDSILKKLPATPVYTTGQTGSVDHVAEKDMGKETLHLLSYSGEFLKPCPGTKHYICCGYQILNLATNCPLDCSYCILQAYMNMPNLRIYANLEQQLNVVCNVIDKTPDVMFRIGTGEFTDSLALDEITGLSDVLVCAFSKRKNAILEFKTKTDRISGLLASKHRDRIVVSWSLNSPFVSAREEKRAASLKKRLQAARQCQAEGFVLGFHFDPLVYHENWREAYQKTIDMMDTYIDPKGIIWISLGSFRFMPELKYIIRRRHPDTCVLDGEFILGLDGKMRYFKPIRLELYSFMRENLDKWRPGMGIYLCMESDDVWQRTMGWSPQDSEGLRLFLDQRVGQIFG
jgi:spore photoproduct lyase